MIGQRLDLVAGLDRDALGKIARPDARRAGAQRLDRHHHVPGEKHPGDEGKRQRAEQDDAGALDRGIERCVSLLDRRFDKHQPTERRDGSVSREHLLTLNIGRFLHLLGGGVGAGGARATHLHQLRHIGIAQHQADVGMSNQAALRIDHVSARMPDGLDLRQHILDQFQIDLATLTPASRRVPASDRVMYGSDSRRK